VRFDCAFNRLCAFYSLLSTIAATFRKPLILLGFVFAGRFGVNLVRDCRALVRSIRDDPLKPFDVSGFNPLHNV
jgi:hypothetical protein